MATLTLSSTDTSVSFSLTGLPSSSVASGVAYFYRWDGTAFVYQSGKDKSFTGSRSSWSGSWSGLTTSHLYQVRTIVYNSGGSELSRLTKQIYTEDPPAPTTVTAFNLVYIDGVRNSSYDEALTVWIGGTYTLFAHAPDVPGKTLSHCVYNGVTYYSSTASITIPSQNVTIYYYYISEYDVTIDYRDIDTSTYLGSYGTFSVNRGEVVYPTSYVPYSITYGGNIYYEYGDASGNTQASYTINSTRTINWFYERYNPIIAPSGTFVVSSKESNTATITATLTASLNSGSWSAQYSPDGVSWYYGSGSSSSLTAGSTCSITFNGLSANTTYYVRLYNTDGETQTAYSGSIGSFRTKLAPIGSFAWTSNDAANIVSGQNPSLITANTWNNSLRAKIAAVAARMASPPTINTNEAVQGAVIKADEHFNDIRAAISNLEGYGSLPAAQSKGRKLNASLFIELKNALNNAITYSNNNRRG